MFKGAEKGNTRVIGLPLSRIRIKAACQRCFEGFFSFCQVKPDPPFPLEPRPPSIPDPSYPSELDVMWRSNSSDEWVSSVFLRDDKRRALGKERGRVANDGSGIG